jgi:transcriptional regulator with XRE-family HTH domain
VTVTTEGARLKAYLGELMGNKYGWPTQLSDQSGVKRATLYKWFRGASTPDLESLRAVAKIVGVSRAQLVAAMDGDAPVVQLDERTTQALDALIERRLEERLGPRTEGGRRAGAA